MKGKIRVTVRRQDPSSGVSPQMQSYEIETDGPMAVLEVLNAIFYGKDPSLSYRRYRCGRRLCRSCEVKVDGKVVRGCATLLRPGETYVLEPARSDTLIRDLVFDFDAPVISGGR